MGLGPVAEPSTAEMRARIGALCPDFDLRFPASRAPEDFAEVVRAARYVATRGLRFPPPEVLDLAPAGVEEAREAPRSRAPRPRAPGQRLRR